MRAGCAVSKPKGEITFLAVCLGVKALCSCLKEQVTKFILADCPTSRQDKALQSPSRNSG